MLQPVHKVSAFPQDAHHRPGGGDRPGFHPHLLGGVNYRDLAGGSLQILQRQIVRGGNAQQAPGFLARVGWLPVELTCQEDADLCIPVEDGRSHVL